LGTLRTAKGDKAALESQLKIAQETAKKAEDKIFKRELKTFFDEAGIPNVDGYESFEKLFSGRGKLRTNPNGPSEGILAEVINRAQATGNPLVMDGLQAAYSRFIRENFLTATREAGGNRMVGLAALNKSENSLNQVLEYGDEVYKDKPLVMQAFRGILEEAGLVQRSKNSKAIGVSSGTAESQQAIAAVNRTVTMTMGVLSRAGARIRAGASGIIMSKFDPIATAQVLDKLMADPDYFIRVAKKVTKEDGAVDPEGAMLLRQWLIRSGIYSEDNEPSEEDFLLQLADAELGYRKGKAEVEQTLDALGDAVLQ
jgi:translation initiation factor 2 beta subunit (eIF-2beta)/eIF-5